MKKLIAGLVPSLIFSSFCWGTVISPSQNNVNWNKASSWNLNRIPQNNDTVNIPSGITVIVNNNIYTTPINLFIKVSGVISFQPNGKIELGSSSVVEILAGGEIISNSTGSERIVIGGTIKYKGNNDGTITGYALANAATPASGSGPGSGFIMGVLAVNIKNFEVVKINNKVHINWQTASEKDASHFEIERSTNANNWKPIYSIRAYNSANGGNYNFTDAEVLQTDVYYRLKSVQKSGGISYSPTMMIRYKENKSKITIYPNPTSDYAIVSLNDNFGNGTLKLLRFDGQLIQTKTFASNTGFVKMEMNGLQKGTYILEIKDAHQQVQTQKIILR